MNVIKLHLSKALLKKKREALYPLFKACSLLYCYHSEQSDLVSKTMQIKSRMLGKWKEIDTGFLSVILKAIRMIGLYQRSR